MAKSASVAIKSETFLSNVIVVDAYWLAMYGVLMMFFPSVAINSFGTRSTGLEQKEVIFGLGLCFCSIAATLMWAKSNSDAKTRRGLMRIEGIRLAMSVLYTLFIDLPVIESQEERTSDAFAVFLSSGLAILAFLASEEVF